MNIKKIKFGHEGFVQKMGIRFEDFDNLELVCTYDLVWCGKEQSDKIKGQIERLIKTLEKK